MRANPVTRWLIARRIRHHRIDDALWRRIVADSDLFDGLDAAARARVRTLAARFIAEKRFFGARGFCIDDTVRAAIAAQACRLVVNLGFDYLDACRTVIVYEEGFVAQREVEDEDGIVHTGLEELAGEAAQGGAVVLAWDDAVPRRNEPDLHGTSVSWERQRPGPVVRWTTSGAVGRYFPTNVVIHEFAHKLDELSGHLNGLPPLPDGMSDGRWPKTFSAAYAELCDMVERDLEPPIDDYAASDPAEFFAVAVETFFTGPDILADGFPQVYALLTELFREDPLDADRSATGMGDG